MSSLLPRKPKSLKWWQTAIQRCTWPAQMPSAMLANLVQIGCPRLTAADRGWFMVVSDPTDQRILWAKPMYEPEGNAVLEEAISEILPSYKNLDGVLVDRACSFVPRASTLRKLKQIKCWAVDGFHAQGHTKTFKCSLRFQRRLAKRFRNTNTSAAEQVFSWFRNYSRILNEAGPLRHSFKVLLFCKKHNEAVENKATGYLRNRKMISKPRSCNKKADSRR